MANFVLIHGSWHGGWCWERVTPILEQRGHQVWAPTLIGLGERAGWRVLDSDSGHDTLVTDPRRLADLLEQAIL